MIAGHKEDVLEASFDLAERGIELNQFLKLAEIGGIAGMDKDVSFRNRDIFKLAMCVGYAGDAHDLPILREAVEEKLFNDWLWVGNGSLAYLGRRVGRFDDFGDGGVFSVEGVGDGEVWALFFQEHKAMGVSCWSA